MINLSHKINKIIIVLLCLFIFLPSLAMATNLSDAKTYADSAAGGAGFDTSQNDINSLIATIIQTLLSLLGVIFLSLLIYGGYLWMTDRGNEEQVKRARNLISAAIIGLIIVLSAYAISVFVLDQLASQALVETAPE
ncbi:hypothetical protein KAJ89_05930 [Candidatus Parcubacteria bacterium]|nr:hypothetical protein [Candidatus Parcubacteria bacterium]